MECHGSLNQTDKSCSLSYTEYRNLVAAMSDEELKAECERRKVSYGSNRTMAEYRLLHYYAHSCGLVIKLD